MNQPPDDLTCRELVELVTSYLEGVLAPEAHELFELHLAACAGCAIHLEQMRETIRLTGSLNEEDLPEQVQRSLLHTFRQWNPTPS